MKNHKNLRIGVIGVGTMGQHHVRIVSNTPGVTLAGLYDPDAARAAEICSRHGCVSFTDLDALLDRCDAVCIASPTVTHLDLGKKCLERKLHVLMEKPLAHDPASAAELVDLAAKAGVVLMVGHVERYNPAVIKLMETLKGSSEEIISVDCRRLAPFDGSRCIDADVLYDLMIHDVDLALEIANSSVLNVTASGRPVFSDKTDVAYARIEFENRAVAVFWTGKCSPKKVRTITVTTPRMFLVADTLDKTLMMHTAEQLPAMDDGICLMGNIRAEQIAVPDEEPLRSELEDFFRAIKGEAAPIVHGQRALAAMETLDLLSRSIAAGGKILEPETSSN
ncbi:MAG: Gfo/Idh/MocA family oxidoreductase [Desulfomonile tiedjei]|uniref:Gfo/Idh/MocA family oxidoreductase n=1 Tax=Desulfomonile tiedjei TaxID=2358 RepID=A0A9D6Z4D0_9BACT|nr:Gfo/Idh/MocA family oxidoreductase [Desulfomonile tiedjei]